MKEMFIKVLKRIKLIGLEVLNVLTDVIVPAVDLVGTILTILPVPKKYLAYVKKAQEFLQKAGATLDDVVEAIDKADGE